MDFLFAGTILGDKIENRKNVEGEQMNNPWEDIKLDDYENHMSLDSVKQLQTMYAIMKEQFEDYPVDTAMIFGIAGGNGLEHVRTEKYSKVYGVDINKDYLNVVSERYKNLSRVLECLQIDLINEKEKIPKSQLVIANLLIEYIGYQAFRDAILRAKPEYVSCVIQINKDDHNWVSDSPYLHAFDRLDEVHFQMEEQELKKTMEEIGYQVLSVESYDLPNGKALLRIDFKKKMKYEEVYLSEFSDVFYVEEKNVAMVHWKKYCELEQYRTPLEKALKVIKDYTACNYVADTRDGFEDNPLDTKWVAEYFMPKAKEYGCRIIYFIIDENNSLKEELEGQQKDSEQLLEFRYIYGIDEVG